MNSFNFLQLIKNNSIDFINFRFTDLIGEQKQITRKTTQINEKFLSHGITIDGSSIKGWNKIDNSDILLKPDLSHFYIEPNTQYKSLNLICDVIDVNNGQSYIGDPRSIAKKSENLLKELGIAKTAYCGPELEFYIFDQISYSNDPLHSFYEINSDEAAESSQYGGYKARRKGSYDAILPIDSMYNLRSEILMTLEEVKNMEPTIHHHEVGNGQCEIGFQYGELTTAADKLQIAKHIIKNVTHKNNKVCTFMPKPFTNDAGSGMHCHFSLFDDKANLFHGDAYCNISEQALHFIGGVAKHIRALCAFTNPTINSYKRLKPGFEAPIAMSYSRKNRSTAIRIPYSDVNSQNETRIECRFPDASANPYLAFSAILMAGIDGILNKICPGEATDFDLFSCEEHLISKNTLLPTSLKEALQALEKDNEFLLRGEVFSSFIISSYLKIKNSEWNEINSSIAPIEFMHYFNC